MRLRWLEWGALFVGLPLLLYLAPIDRFRFAILIAATLYALGVVLVHRPSFAATGEPVPQHLAWRIPIVVTLIFAFSWLAFPARFLDTPEHHARLWLAILIAYPLASALPQEFLYRRFYFWRYAPLFPNPALMLGSNILLFAFLHIIYDNDVAVFMSLCGGVLFTISYRRTGRLLPVWFEHSIYGLAIFSSGLGHFFYKPFA